MGVELPLRVVVTILECCVTFSGVKLSIRSFVLLHKMCWVQKTFPSIDDDHPDCDQFPATSDIAQKIIELVFIPRFLNSNLNMSQIRQTEISKQRWQSL